MAYELKLFSGNANRALAEEIAQYLRVPLGDAEVSRFSDGEIFVQINENVRGADVFVVQPTCPPVNDTLMELLIMIDALKRASARRITAVLPYYGYARQDRKVAGRAPITAKLVADLLEAAGVNRVLALDLHAGQIQGFFNIPVDHLFAAPAVIDRLPQEEGPERPGGRVARRRRRRARPGHRQAAEQRPGHHRQAPRRPQRRRSSCTSSATSTDRDVVVIDDMIDTAGTLVQAVGALQREGAQRILACGVHAVLSGPAIERIKASPHRRSASSPTRCRCRTDKRAAGRITVLSVAPLLGEAIRRIHDEESVSTLFV